MVLMAEWQIEAESASKFAQHRQCAEKTQKQMARNKLCGINRTLSLIETAVTGS